MMKVIDPHVDVADMYAYKRWDVGDFYDSAAEVWVTLPKLRQSAMDVIGLTLYCDHSLVTTTYYEGVKSFYHFYQRLLEQADSFSLIDSAEAFNQKPSDRIGYFYTIEGFECLRSPEDFVEFYNLGVRSFGFTWCYENEYASGRQSVRDEGVTNKGKQVLSLMREKQKLIVDIAHLGEASVNDVAKGWDGMIVSTHGNAREIHPSNHNLTDEEISLIAERNGVVSVFPLVEDVGGQGTFEDLYRHVDYIGSRWGVDHIAFSTDIYPVPEYPFIGDAQDITIAKDWTLYLESRLDRAIVEQILWGNWARVLRESL